MMLLLAMGSVVEWRGANMNVSDEGCLFDMGSWISWM